MKKLICLLLLYQSGSAQTISTIKKKNSYPHAVSAGIVWPLGDFSSTHWAGIQADYSPSGRVFGVPQLKKWSFTYNGGLAYYWGKKELVSNYPYRYPGYFFVHGFAGLLFRPDEKVNFTLTAGPALGLYNGNLRFNVGTKLDASFVLNEKWAIGPGILLRKEGGANALWSAAFKVTMIF